MPHSCSMSNAHLCPVVAIDQQMVMRLNPPRLLRGKKPAQIHDFLTGLPGSGLQRTLLKRCPGGPLRAT